MLPSRRSNMRRYITPAIILIVGGSLAIWASQRERDRIGRMEQQIHELCQMASRGENLIDRLNTADRYLNGPISNALREACAGLADRPEAIRVIATSGDAGRYGGGEATHIAMIRIDGVDQLGLHLLDDGSEIFIVGYSRPDGPLN